MFAPAGGRRSVRTRTPRLALRAMTNLMCRGRKRGLAGVIATQRLAKLAKNVAAEASNFLMGRTFLDIDMARAADLLGMERRQAEADPRSGARPFPRARPGGGRAARWRSRSARSRPSARSCFSPKLTPLPEAPAEDFRDLLLAPAEPNWTPPAPPTPVPTQHAVRNG